MARFLHVADVHLGFDRYDCKERTLDFFYAFQDVLERYAIADQVDFVLIAGDLFEHRMIQPAILSQAQICLESLQEAGIPVLAIEGNHDNRPFGTKTSWLRYLCDQGLLMLLEPETDDKGQVCFNPWDPDARTGGYVDLSCGVRVFGSCWYGANAPQAIAQLAGAIAKLKPTSNSQVMMFHHGLEGQIARYAGALRYSDILPLKEVGIQYLALGHIHKHYAIDGWIYNPGSIEANNIEESQYERGAYQVEITRNKVHATLVNNYYQRPIYRYQLKLKGNENVEEIKARATELIQQEQKSSSLSDIHPIIELKIEGDSGIDPLELSLKEFQKKLQNLSSGLIFLLKWNAISKHYETPTTNQLDESELEQSVFVDILSTNTNYRSDSQNLAECLQKIRDMVLENQSLSEMYNHLLGQ